MLLKSPRVVTPPASEPVSLSEAKGHVRVEITDDDAYIGDLLVAAREWGENYQGRSWISRTLALTLDEFPTPPFRLPMGPVQSVESVKYTGSDGVEATVDPALYYLDDAGRLCLAYGASWPSVTLRPYGGVAVTYVAGYGADAESVPRRFKQAVLLLVGHWYEHREEVVTGTIVSRVPVAAVDLLSQDRVVPV